jgi:hypothetical protein
MRFVDTINSLKTRAEVHIQLLRAKFPQGGIKVSQMLDQTSHEDLKAMYVDLLHIANELTKLYVPDEPYTPVTTVRAAPGAFQGPRYTLSRDEKIVTMEQLPTEKTCRECGKDKPNNFTNFGKKWSGTRTNYITVDVCKVCANAKISKGVFMHQMTSGEAQYYDQLTKEQGLTHEEAAYIVKRENALERVIRLEKAKLKADGLS